MCSSNLPADGASHALLLSNVPAYLVLLQMEVTAFHVHTRKCLLVSVALFLALGVLQHLLRTAVSRHPALCSPDFPLPNCRCNIGSDCLANFLQHCIS